MNTATTLYLYFRSDLGREMRFSIPRASGEITGPQIKILMDAMIDVGKVQTQDGRPSLSLRSERLVRQTAPIAVA